MRRQLNLLLSAPLIEAYGHGQSEFDLIVYVIHMFDSLCYTWFVIKLLAYCILFIGTRTYAIDDVGSFIN